MAAFKATMQRPYPERHDNQVLHMGLSQNGFDG